MGQRWRTHRSAPTATSMLYTLLPVPEEDREEGEGLRGTGVPRGNILNMEPIQCLLKDRQTFIEQDREFSHHLSDKGLNGFSRTSGEQCRK